jgi:hypothetical protein
MPSRVIELLGTIATEALLQNVSIDDPDSPICDALRLSFEGGFRVSAEWEIVGALTEEEKKVARARFQLATNHDEILEALRSNKRFVRLIMEPK